MVSLCSIVNFGIFQYIFFHQTADGSLIVHTVLDGTLLLFPGSYTECSVCVYAKGIFCVPWLQYY